MADEDLASFREVSPVCAQKLEKSLEIVFEAIKVHGKHVGISFNGGKDACVCLEVLRLGLQLYKKKFPDMSFCPTLQQVPVMYYRHEKNFEEMDKFVEVVADSLQLSMVQIGHQSMRDGLREFIEKSGCSAILMGTRSGDPYSADMTPFMPTDKDWPQIVRVNPILDWNYEDVWAFLLHFKTPYCALYDAGYTSVGHRDNTLPNSALRKEDGCYSPAYMLKDGTLERHGRK